MGHDWEEVWTDLGGGSRRLDRTVCRECGLVDDNPRFGQVRTGPFAGQTVRHLLDARTCLEVTVDAVHDL